MWIRGARRRVRQKRHGGWGGLRGEHAGAMARPLETRCGGYRMWTTTHWCLSKAPNGWLSGRKFRLPLVPVVTMVMATVTVMLRLGGVESLIPPCFAGETVAGVETGRMARLEKRTDRIRDKIRRVAPVASVVFDPTHAMGPCHQPPVLVLELCHPTPCHDSSYSSVRCCLLKKI